jgi:hypothetical protein
MEIMPLRISSFKQTLMAEINSGGNDRSHKGGPRSKKLSTKVDLTPMVDLGFLLITFFMISTAWTRPSVMKLNLPVGETPTTVAPQSATLTIIPVAGDKAFYFHGDLQKAIQSNDYGTTNFSITGGIGDVIRKKQQYLDKYFKGGRNEMILIVKPSTGAFYKSIVDVLDEMVINQVKTRILTDITKEERKILTDNNLGWVLQ